MQIGGQAADALNPGPVLLLDHPLPKQFFCLGGSGFSVLGLNGRLFPHGHQFRLEALLVQVRDPLSFARKIGLLVLGEDCCGFCGGLAGQGRDNSTSLI